MTKRHSQILPAVLNALALNSTGTVVVGYARYGMNYRAMVWTNGEMRDLNTVVRNASGWLLTSATGVDDTGAIVRVSREYSRKRSRGLRFNQPLALDQ